MFDSKENYKFDLGVKKVNTNKVAFNSCYIIAKDVGDYMLLNINNKLRKKLIWCLNHELFLVHFATHILSRFSFDFCTLFAN